MDKPNLKGKEDGNDDRRPKDELAQILENLSSACSSSGITGVQVNRRDGTKCAIKMTPPKMKSCAMDEDEEIEIREEVDGIKDSITALNQKVDNLSESIERHIMVMQEMMRESRDSHEKLKRDIGGLNRNLTDMWANISSRGSAAKPPVIRIPDVKRK